MKRFTITWKIYGIEGHSQAETFNPYVIFDFSNGENVRIIEIINSDKTGTNYFSIMRVTRNTAEDCERELWGQIRDGIFENCRVGKVEEMYRLER